MLYSIAWKEYREHRTIWIAILFVALICMVSVVYLLQPMGEVTGKADWLAAIALALMATYGMVCGSMMIAGEREGGTLPYLDWLSYRTPIWAAKLLVGFVFTVAHAGAICLLLYWFLDTQLLGKTEISWEFVLSSNIYLSVLAAGIIGLIWGLIFSSFAGSVLISVCCAAIVTLVMVPMTFFGGPPGTMIVGILSSVALFGSWRYFCGQDIGREPRVGFLPLYVVTGCLVIFILLSVCSALYGVGEPRGSIRGMFQDAAPLLMIGGIATTVVLGLRIIQIPEIDTAQPERAAHRVAITAWRNHLLQGLALAGFLGICMGLLSLINILINYGSLNSMVWDRDIVMDRTVGLTLLGFGFVVELYIGCMFVTMMLSRGADDSFLKVLTRLGVFGACCFVIYLVSNSVGELLRLPSMLLIAPWSATILISMHGVLASSALLITWREFKSRHLTSLEERSESWLMRLLMPTSWGSSLWLVWRQGKTGAITLLILGLIVGLSLGTVPTYTSLLIWPLAALLLSCFSGVGVFAGEQIWSARRFMADQRLPVGRIWATKTMFWAGVAFFSSIIMFIGPGLHSANLSTAIRSELYEQSEYFVYNQIQMTGGFNFLFLPIVYGFCLGQFFAMLMRNSAAAVILSIIVSVMSILIWLPSFLMGGVYDWQLYSLPILALIATRLLMWTWAAEGLMNRRAIGILGTCAALGGTVTVGGLWMRVTEAGPAEAPFDVAEFKARVAQAEESEATRTISSLLIEFGDKFIESMPSDAKDIKELYTYTKAIDQVWPKDPSEKINQIMDEIWKEEYQTRLAEILQMPLGLYVRPDSVKPPSKSPMLFQFARMFADRALQQQAMGKPENTPQLFATALMLSRYMQHLGSIGYFNDATNLEEIIFKRVDQWVVHLRDRPDLIRELLTVLNDHTKHMPDVRDNIKSQYLNHLAALESPHNVLPLGKRNSVTGAILSDLLLQSWVVPWEAERRMRLLNAHYAGTLRAADLPFIALKRQMMEFFESGSRGGIWIPEEGGVEEWAAHFDRFHSSWLRGYIGIGLSDRLTHQRTLAETRRAAARLKVAIALFQAESSTSNPPRELSELVPKYLPSLPVDPYVNLDFHYVVVSPIKEQSERFPTSTRPRDRAVPPDFKGTLQAIFWSVGPDCVDNGGAESNEVRAAGLSIFSSGADIPFSVPRVSAE